MSGNCHFGFTRTDGSRVGIVFRTTLGQQNLLFKMADSTFSRKLDTSGRIMIPIKLRDQMGLVIGKEYFFSTMEKNGHRFICIDCGPLDDDVEKAMQLLQSKGMKVVKDDD